jgi:hypothetical protein
VYAIVASPTFNDKYASEAQSPDPAATSPHATETRFPRPCTFSETSYRGTGPGAGLAEPLEREGHVSRLRAAHLATGSHPAVDVLDRVALSLEAVLAADVVGQVLAGRLVPADPAFAFF